jgi:hypothetical protein
MTAESIDRQMTPVAVTIAEGTATGNLTGES